MDVELPDGTIVQGVPDGMSKAELVAKLRANGHDLSWLEGPSTKAAETQATQDVAAAEGEPGVASNVGNLVKRSGARLLEGATELPSAAAYAAGAAPFSMTNASPEAAFGSAITNVMNETYPNPDDFLAGLSSNKTPEDWRKAQREWAIKQEERPGTHGWAGEPAALKQAQADWDESRRAGYAPEKAPTLAERAGSAVRTFASPVTESAPVRGVRDWAKEAENNAVAALSPKVRRALELSLVEHDEENGGIRLGEGATNPWWWTGNLIDVGVQMAPGMGTTALAARLGYAGKYRAVLAELATQKIPQSEAIKVAERAALSAGKRAAVIAGGLTEGATGGGQDAAQTRETINQLDEETLMNYPGYVELRDEGLTHEQARDRIASDKAAAVAVSAGTVIGITGAPMNAWFGGLTAKLGRAPKAGILGRLKEAGKGAAGEAGQEFVQEGSEQYIQNKAEGPVTGAKPWDNVLENAITGGVLGGVIGFGEGGLTHKAGKKPAPSETPENIPATTSALEDAKRAYAASDEALKRAEMAARDPSVSMKYADLQAVRDAHKQAVVDYTRELLHAGQIKPKDQAAVADALRQAEAEGITAKTRKPATAGNVSPARDAALEAVAGAQELEESDANDLVANGLAKVNPRGIMVLTPEGRRQRKAAADRAAAQNEEVAAPKPASNTKKPPPGGAGAKVIDEAKVAEGGPTVPKKKPTLRVPGERREIASQREAQRAERAQRPAKELAAERAKVAADVAVTPESVAGRARELAAGEAAQVAAGGKGMNNPQLREAFEAAAVPPGAAPRAKIAFSMKATPSENMDTVRKIAEMPGRGALHGAIREEAQGLIDRQTGDNPPTAEEIKTTIARARRAQDQGRARTAFRIKGAPGAPKAGALVNIGLKTNDGGEITAQDAVKALRARGVSVTRHATHTSDTEPTLVARLNRELTPEEATGISKDLKQDAIAQLGPDSGALHGPAAEKWGSFNPDYFLTMEGKRASEQPSKSETLRFKHFSSATEPRIELNPERMGTGVKGAEAKRNGPKVTSLYAEHGETEPDVANGRNRYNVEVPAEDLYNASEDPQGFLAKAQVPVGITKNEKGEYVPVSHRFDMNKFEEMVRDAGYTGYHTPGSSGILKGQARLFHPYPATREGATESDRATVALRTKKPTSEAKVRGFLTPGENARLKNASAKKVASVFDELPSGAELAAAAVAGQVKRGWYRRSSEALVNVFGPDAPRFAALLGAMSPRTTVHENLLSAVRVWVEWDKAGRPTDRAGITKALRDGSGRLFGAHHNNTVRALSAEDPSSVTLSGPKADSFAANLRGEVERVTLDAWMASWAGVKQELFKGEMTKDPTNPGLRPGYLAFSARVREAAQLLTERTGETWTPAEVQETVWSWAKTLYEQAESFGALATARELVDNQELTDELINATPDFAGLFEDPQVSASLAGTVYGERAARSAGQTTPGSRAAGKATPAAEQDQRHLRRAADRLDALRKSRQEAEAETRAEGGAAVKQTDTEAFKRWFGNSKVVNADGTPKIVYHGTAIKKSKFRREGGAAGVGAYFTPDRADALDYAERDAEIDGGRATVMPVYLSIQNPKIVRGTESFGVTVAQRDQLEAQGFDGIHNTENEEYLAFHPTQIKSVGNRGTFDPNNPNIAMATTEARPERGLPRSEVDAVATRLQDELGLATNVVDRQADLPPHVQELIPDGAQVTGFFYEDPVSGATETHLVRENIDSQDEAYETALHEAVGHMGLRAILGANYHKVLESIRASFPAQVAAAARRNGIDMNHADPATRRRLQSLATEEMIAYAAGRVLAKRGALSEQNVWRKIIAKVREVLRSLGLLNHWSNEEIEALIYRARDYFRKPAEKRAAELAHAGNVAMAEKGGKPGPVWHSAVEQFIDTLSQSTATGKQWWGTIKNGKGVKQEELDWLGLEDWLNSQGDQKVPREKLLDYVRANKMQVRDVQYGENNSTYYERESLIAALAEEQDISEAMAEEVINDIAHGDEPLGGISSSLLQAARELRNGPTLPPKYAQYQTPGGENYRELLLTLPALGASRHEVRPSRSRGGWAIVEDGQEIANYASESEARNIAVKSGFSPAAQFKSGHWSEPNILVHVRFNERTVAGKKVLFLEEVQSDWHQQGRKRGYGPNEDMRSAYRAAQTQYDEWKKRAREGAAQDMIRKSNGKIEPEFARAAVTGITDEMIAKFSNTEGEFASVTAELNRTMNQPNRVPEAPFKTSWPELAMKRMIRYAAENGFDQLAWTTGAMQAERYDLSKQVSRIEYREANGHLRAYPAGRTDTEDAVVSELGVTPEKLVDFVGKEAADKLMQKAPDRYGSRVLKGLDLKIGGEGMKGFYDKLLPKTVDKYVKKWGAKVEPLDIQTSKGAGKEYVVQRNQNARGAGVWEVFVTYIGEAPEAVATFRERSQAEAEAAALNRLAQAANTGPTPVHSVSITPEMRESVLESQPMFAMKPIKLGDTMREIPMQGGMNDEQRERADALELAGRGVEQGGDWKTIGYVRPFMGTVEDDLNPAPEREGEKPKKGAVKPDVVFPPDFDTVIRGNDPFKGFTEVKAYADGQEIGYVSMSEDRVSAREGQEGWSAEYVYVKPEYRGKGVAQAMYKAISDKLGVPAKPSYAQTGLGRNMWASFRKRNVAFAYKVPPTGNADLDSFISKIGVQPKSLRERWNEFKHGLGESINMALFDELAGIQYAERIAGIPESQQGYVSARLSRAASEVTASIIEHGPPVWNGGAPDVGKGMGLLDILKPLKGNVNLWLTYMSALRAQRLAGQGRENLFTPAEIAAAAALGQQHPEFAVARQQYNALQKQVLDFAQEGGVIDPQTRAMWEHADYVPFYRIMSGGEVTVPSNAGRGIGFVRQQIRKLKGGRQNIGDPLENIVRNWQALVDASLQAYAGRMTVDNLNGTGLVTPNKNVANAAPIANINALLKANPALATALQNAGINVANIPPQALAGLSKMLNIGPTEDNAITVWRNGQRESWNVHDPNLLRSLKNLNPKLWGPWMKLFSIPKRLYTKTVTLTPQFMAKNFWRDMWHTFVTGAQSDKTRINMLPTNSIAGLTSALANSPEYKSMVAGGGGFGESFVETGDPASMAASVRRAINKGKTRGFLLNTPVKVWRFYKALQAAAENANRVAVYRKSLAAGISRRNALFQARDLMDFSMRGNSELVRLIVGMTPFFNARLQGLGRLGRGFKASFASVALRGLLLSGMALALLARNHDDERYKALTDQEKSNYWHFFDVFQKGDHFKLPKPFEVGTIFGTVPETLTEAMVSDEPDAGKQALNMLGYSFGQTLSLTPQPTTVWPLVELAINQNTFTGSPILTQGDEAVLPEDQRGPTTSPTYAAIANAMPDIAPEALRSPKQLEHLGRGYLGNIQDYVLMASDALVREARGEPPPPARASQDVPGLRDFYTRGPARNNRYIIEMYKLADEAAKVHASINRAEKADTVEGDKRVEELEQKYGPLIDVQKDFEKAAQQVTDLKKQQREIQLDDTMTPQEKREEIDAIQQDINDIAKDVYDLRPGGKLNPDTAGQLIVAPPAARATILKKNGLPATASLLESLG